MVIKIDSPFVYKSTCLFPGKVAEFFMVDTILCPDWPDRE
jgi:hypothetical protein